MIVVSSSGLSGTTSKPVMMSTGVKTVSVRGGSNQILTGQTGQTMMIGGKPVTVLTSGAAAGKTVQLVSGVSGSGGQQVMMAGGQQMVVMQGQAAAQTGDGPVSSEAALAQLAAEAGLLEAGGEAGESAEQLDGGYVTPQDSLSELGDPVDIQHYLDMFSSQVDGDPGEVEAADSEQPGEMETEEAAETTETTETSETTETTESIAETGETEVPAEVPAEPQTETEKASAVPEIGEELPVTSSSDPTTTSTEVVTESSPDIVSSETQPEAGKEEKEEVLPPVTESSPVSTDQADIDGASALAALASAPSLTESVSLSPSGPSITTVKTESGGSVSTQSITSPLSATSALQTSSVKSELKNELDEVSLTVSLSLLSNFLQLNVTQNASNIGAQY